jgi:hypothetical protein
VFLGGYLDAPPLPLAAHKQEKTPMTSPSPQSEDELVQARRKFLSACGKFSIATPPAIAMLLAASERNYAVAASGGGAGKGRGRGHGHHHHHGNNGWGNGGRDGVPGRSRHSDDFR